MNKYFILFVIIFNISFCVNAQITYFEAGLGIKYDKFNIDQPENVFKRNLDLGASAYISYSRPFNNDRVFWEAGLATNNYKLNFKVTSPEGEIFSSRELVSVMRSNRIFANITHKTRSLTKKLTWVNSAGISLLIGAKNPYDVILQRSKEIETSSGPQSIYVNIKTYGKTGSGILIGAGTRLYYQLTNVFNITLNASFITGLSELTKVDVNYVLNSSLNYKKAVFSSNGFAPMLTFGVQYVINKDK